MQDQDPIKAPILKAVLAATAALSMEHIILIGQVAGALYAVAVLCEWVWKRMAKPALRKVGWIKRAPGGGLFTDHGKLDE